MQNPVTKARYETGKAKAMEESDHHRFKVLLSVCIQ